MANFSKIKDIAKVKGITLAQLAAEIGRTTQALSLIVNGDSTNTKTIEAIAKVLDVSPAVFFDDNYGIDGYKQQSIANDDSLAEKMKKIIEQKDEIIEQQSKIIQSLLSNR